MAQETIINSTANRKTYYVHWYPANPSLKGSLHNENGPLHKYDQAFGANSLSFENTHNKRNTRWEGHCHAASVVASILDEPKKTVTFNGIVFTPDDIKGLLVKIVSSLPFESLWIGQRYPEGEIQEPRPKKLYKELKEWSQHYLPVVFDVVNTEEVWNYPFDRVVFDFDKGEMSVYSNGFSNMNKTYTFDWNNDTWLTNENVDFAWLPKPTANLRSLDSFPVQNSKRMNPFYNPEISPKKVGEIYLQSL